MAKKNEYSVGIEPPIVTWTIVRGDTAAFEIYVADADKNPLIIADWDMLMEIKRYNKTTSSYDLITTVTPEEKVGVAGTIIINLNSDQSVLLSTGDVFDIELSDPTRVWTIATGSFVVIKDITNS